MDQIIEFFKGLFSHDEWPPRWECGYWSDFHGWLYIVSELMVWTAYFLIPLIIINYFYKKRSTIRFRRVYLLFATFILLCGSTHFIDALMFWIPMYRFNAVVRLATGIVSLFTVYHLFKVLPDLFAQRTNLELEKEIARREEAERKLAEANMGLKAFAYVASHDLQEPLRKIRTFSGMLYNSNKNNFDETSRSYAEKIISSSERMQSLVQDVLNLSTISENIEPETVKPNAVIDKVSEDLDIRIAEKNALIEADRIPAVKGNEAYLRQLFFNLIGNAIKFNERQPHIRITGEQTGDRVIIKISDNGIGMLKEDLHKIFEAFQRLHSKGRYEGTGIGLAIVKKIVEVHGGKIAVESTPGAGTTFIIELPAAE
jgi:two-component system, chemotaxis family, sensor kinase Cph1